MCPEIPLAHKYGYFPIVGWEKYGTALYYHKGPG